MILIDSNILIYSAQEKHKGLRSLFNQNCLVSAISKLEVLGFHSITGKQIAYFESIFAITNVITISDETIETAIQYRQKAKVSVGDAIVVATAIIHNCDLCTRNVDDFKTFPDISKNATARISRSYEKKDQRVRAYIIEKNLNDYPVL